MTVRDRRLHAFRPDLADARLQGEVTAERFVAGRPARVAVAVADVLKAPQAGSGIDTQFLFGDDVLVFETAGGFANHVADLFDLELNLEFLEFVENLPHVAALDVVHHQVELLTFFAEVEDRNDVGVTEVHRDFRFFAEHLFELGIFAELGKDALHGEELVHALRADRLRQIDFRHPAGGEFLEEDVFAESFHLGHH